MKILLGVILLPIIGLALWLGSAFVYQTWNTYPHRYRIIVEADTPGGLKTGSGVIAVEVIQKAKWVPQAGGTLTDVWGDAIFVDLGDGKNIVALLGMGPTGAVDGIYRLAATAFGRSRESYWYREARNWTGKAELTSKDYPTLVTFSNVNDPSTATVLDGASLSSVFGSGYDSVKISIEMTSDPVSYGITKHLPWVESYEKRKLAWRAINRGSRYGPAIDTQQLFHRRGT